MGKPNPIPGSVPWKKGQSGNPNGRPRKIPELDKLLADILGEEKDGFIAAEIILKALRKKAASGDVRAAEVLLDRAYGKAQQVIHQASVIKIIDESTDSTFTPPSFITKENSSEQEEI